jgi:hypothetical protein
MKKHIVEECSGASTETVQRWTFLMAKSGAETSTRSQQMPERQQENGPMCKHQS